MGKRDKAFAGPRLNAEAGETPVLDDATAQPDHDSRVVPFRRPGSAEGVSDADLIARACRGDESAYGALMTRYGPLAAACVYGKLKNTADLEDVIQEIFWTAYRNLGQLRDPGRFGPWLARIARNAVNDYYRAMRRNDRVRSAVSMPEADTAPGPSERAAEAQLNAAVHMALGGLRPVYRTVVHMRLIGDLMPAEIAGQLGMKESTVRMRLKRGLDQLRHHLRKQGY